MATPLAVRPSHSSVGSVAAGRRLGVEGVAPARVAWAAGTRGAKGFTLRCSLDESSAASGSTSPVVDVAPPTIHLEILGPNADEEVTTTSVGSGDKLLRNIILDNKLELYGLYGKVMNCGGGGSCGTCVVEILEGKELLNERTDTEYKYLKKKPESWRLSCQTIVGDKSNSGKVVVQRLPQKKK
ncbi:hypothetical protein M758_6G110600 [Ceratodon purpureus]|uniref:2Fe-2S ferredoxin-type domain-containing protein n=1 Tax=Ceratodon purpureus TaxID=3225 RepID=A0A8T0HDC7_CERPU|nr:hypothetical protein KC19_6G115400 [Ceratodon purpureus]KAG0613540.1 hypothetical protein M758_6G110600 [Ceratodon purpureus]